MGVDGLPRASLLLGVGLLVLLVRVPHLPALAIAAVAPQPGPSWRPAKLHNHAHWFYLGVGAGVWDILSENLF